MSDQDQSITAFIAMSYSLSSKIGSVDLLIAGAQNPDFPEQQEFNRDNGDSVGGLMVRLVEFPNEVQGLWKWQPQICGADSRAADVPEITTTAFGERCTLMETTAHGCAISYLWLVSYAAGDWIKGHGSDWSSWSDEDWADLRSLVLSFQTIPPDGLRRLRHRVERECAMLADRFESVHLIPGTTAHQPARPKRRTSASATDHERWKFAKPLREQTPAMKWEEIHQRWHKKNQRTNGPTGF